MALVEPTTKISEPIPRIIRPGRPAKTAGNGYGNGHREPQVFHFAVDGLDGRTELEGIRKDVFSDRYVAKDEEGKPTELYPEQMWLRVAYALAEIEKTDETRRFWREKFYNVLKDFKFVPGGRILSGAGTGYQVTFFNCYVIPSPEDSRGGIIDNIKVTVEIQSRAGGVGVNLSSLRPKGARVQKVNGTSSGPVNWACLYSTANYDVIQQGGSRRGALMLMLNDWHPDVEEFVHVKSDLTKIPGANLSVCVSDAFMEAVKNDANWDLVFPDTTDPDYDLFWEGDIDQWRGLGKSVKIYKTVRAREIWQQIAQAAWQSAEPGVVFIDRYNKESNTWYFEKIICTNPCGEQGLGAWAVCDLGSMNLVPYIASGKFDFAKFAADAKVAVRLLDNTIDANHYFYEENKKNQLEIRRTGLGIMGLADAMIVLGMRYGSEESIKFTEDVYRTLRDAAYQASVEIAAEKGPFLKFDKEKYLRGQFIQRLPEDIKEGIAQHGIRNAVLLTQAPTGTTSILAGVNSGIEPVFEFSYKRTDRTGEHLVEHELLRKWKETHQGENIPDYFVSSSQLSPQDHVRVQAAAQKYIDSSISKTVNAPNNYTVEDVEKLYDLAYELGCKGVAFFRDGSRTGVLAKVGAATDGHGPQETAQLKSRPVKVEGATYRIETPLGTAFITVNQDEQGSPFEVFISIGKAGSEVAAMAEALGRLISTTLRFGNHLPARQRAVEIVEQLSGIGGPGAVGFGPNRVRSLPDAVAKAMALHFGLNGQNNEVHKDTPIRNAHRDLCPACGVAAFVFEEGCAKCYSCGYSKC